MQGLILRGITCLTLTTVFFFSLVFVGNLQVRTVQGYEEVNGIIASDTTWTKMKSPYNLTGNVAIDKDVTLTIEPGVTVNLNKYYIVVNGTLSAKGSSTDNIFFNGGFTEGIQFTTLSAGWNQQSGTGCIIENAIIKSTLSISGGSPLISKNTINRIIGISGGSPIISKNTIIIEAKQYVGIVIINDNTALISDNTISGYFNDATICIEGGSPTIQRNRISNRNGYGYEDSCAAILIYYANYAYKVPNPLIQQNIITKSANGISLRGNSNPTIINNNFEDNSNYNLYMRSTTVNIEAANNWWDTTDTAVIDQKIFDFNDDFILGKVNYTPFLTATNPQAGPNLNAPIPTLAPTTFPTSTPNTSTPTSTANQTDYGDTVLFSWAAEIVIIALLSAIVVLLVINSIQMHKRNN